MAGVSIFSTLFKNSVGQKIEKKTMPEARFCLVQLGQVAKIKTLSLIELLRTHRIQMHHLLGKDKITVQLTNAENLGVSHLIIIGQKEALDNTATIRNMSTRAQDTVNMEDLPRYLKNIRL
jgi:histidyl-tRNA synthetase